MDGLASTAIYLASSLTVAQPPATTLRATTVTVTLAMPGPIAVPGLGRTVTLPPAAARPIATAFTNPFTQARLHGGRSLSEAIAAEVRRDAAGRPAPDDDPTSGGDVALGGAASWDGGDGDTLNQDVTAAHDVRIADIARQLASARSGDGAATPTIGRLTVKLRLAMAARRLAVAREAIGDIGDDCPRAGDPDRCGAALPILAAAADRQPRLIASHRQMARRDAAGARHDPSLHMHARSPQQFAAGASHRAARAAPAAGAQSLADASLRARRSLATARHLLETGLGPGTGTAAATGHRARADLKLAGLIKWEGSEIWSLAAYQRIAGDPPTGRTRAG